MDSTTKMSCFKCNSTCAFIDVTKSNNIKELFGCSCDLCKRILCRNCSKLFSSEVRALTAQTKVISFFCQECLKEIRKHIKDIPNIQNQVSELGASTQQIKETLHSELKKLQTNIKEIKSTYAEIVSRKTDFESTKAVQDDIKHLKKVIQTKTMALTTADAPGEAVLQELQERQLRSKNILIFGLHETNIQNREDREKDEKAKVNNILKQCVDTFNEEIQYYRLGKPDEGKVRPIKVVLKSIETVIQILRNKNKLPKDSQSYIKPDLTIQQREYLRKLVTELKSR
ncbi:unnamed protein product [Ceutorhynchus assimilis]|uniref:Uncharacterized protein n=1 Tax=Ceutorhynchus assimilis TaxID=467358 RepID=A0A9N9MH16_9CUCU|nr:unnamed protein product [Ceutorhynchus assimilis]